MTDTAWSHVVEVPRPHGFLLWRGKQTAIPSREPLPDGEPCLVVSDGEAFGTVTLGKAASMQVKEFDRIEWTDRHRTRQEERKMWWKGARKLVVQDVTKAEWYPESVPIDVERDDDGLIIDVSFKDTAPVTDDEQALIGRAQRMPRLIMLSSDALGLTGGKLYDPSTGSGQAGDVVVVDDKARPLLPFYKGQLETALCAVFDCPEDGITYTDTKGCCRLPLYWLALVRAPRFGIERSDVSEPEFKSLDVDQLRRAWHKQSTEVNMPYTHDDYPEQIENLPEAARNLWVDAYNAAFEEHNDEDIARRVAWTVVNRDYERDDDGQWQAREKRAVIKEAAVTEAFYLQCPDLGMAEIKDTYIVVQDGDKLYRVDYGEDLSFEPREIWVELEYQEVKDSEPLEVDEPEVSVTDEQPASEADKAGRRLRADRVGLLRDLKDRLGGLGDAIAELLGWAEYADAEPESVAELFNKEAGFAIKEVDSVPWFFSWSANAFKDRDEEIFSTAALERYVDEAETKKERGFFNFWHIPGTDFARKEWQAVVGRFLVEAGPFLDDEKGRAASKFFDKYSDGHPDYAPEGWGASVEYKYLPEERDTGIYKWIYITRTTALPRSSAANIWTEAGKGANIMALDGQRKEAAVEMFGQEYVDDLIDKAEKRTEELEADVEFKEVGEETTEAEVTEEKTPDAEAEITEPEAEKEPVVEEEVTTEDVAVTEEFVKAVADKVAENFTVDLQPVVDVVKALTEGVDGLGKRVAKIEKDETLKQKTELPRFQLQMVKRASNAEETAVEDGDTLKESKPTATEKHTDGSAASAFFGDK